MTILCSAPKALIFELENFPNHILSTIETNNTVTEAVIPIMSENLKSILFDNDAIGRFSLS
jgi:hypothetical protein